MHWKGCKFRHDGSEYTAKQAASELLAVYVLLHSHSSVYVETDLGAQCTTQLTAGNCMLHSGVLAEHITVQDRQI